MSSYINLMATIDYNQIIGGSNRTLGPPLAALDKTNVTEKNNTEITDKMNTEAPLITIMM